MRFRLWAFLLYSLLLWWMVSITGFGSFKLVEYYFFDDAPTMNLFGDNWMILIIILVNMLPYSIGMGWRASKYEVEAQAPFEYFVNVFSNAILLFFIGVGLVCVFVQWALLGQNLKFWNGVLEVFLLAVPFWLEVFPLNLMAIVVMVGLNYLADRNMDKYLFKGQVVSKRNNTPLLIYGIHLTVTVFVITLCISGMLYHLIEWFLDFSLVNNPERSFWARQQNQMPYIAVALLPYAVLIGMQVRRVERLQEQTYRRWAAGGTLLLAVVLGLLAVNIAFSFVNNRDLFLALKFGFSNLIRSVELFLVSFPLNLMIMGIGLPLTFFWYRYMGQFLSATIEQDTYEHLISEE